VNNRGSLLLRKEVAENSRFPSAVKMPHRHGKPCSEVPNEGFSLFFLFEQGSGPSIALAETGSGKLALFGGNRRARGGTRSSSTPLKPPVVGG
jgi:hypothetical protein